MISGVRYSCYTVGITVNTNIMKNIIILILLALLGFVGYQYLSKEQTTTVVDDTPTENSANNVGQEVVSENTEEVSDPDEQDTPSADPSEEALSYCQTLKSNISGSANYVITTELTDGTLISSGDNLSGCIYAPNGTYGNWGPFEGQIGSYEVLSSTGDVLGTGPIPVVPTDWLTPALSGDDIEYATTLNFDATGYISGSVVMKNANASGESATEEIIVISVTF